jgi:ABC-type uncharacterized transport system substrate-binding protein
MRRREFIALLGGAAAAWPLSARAQQQMPVVGFLRSSALSESTHLVTAFRQGLKQAGFIEGQNVAIEFHSAEEPDGQLSALVADLIRRQVNVIVGDSPSAFVAKASTRTIPFVFATGSDPVRDGLVVSLSRPGGNFTGVVFFNSVLGAKRLELLRHLVPKATKIGMLVNPNTSSTVAERKDVEAAALELGSHLVVLDVNSVQDIEAAFPTLVQHGVNALLVNSGGFLNSNRKRVVALATRHALPSAHSQREAVVDGALMSYGASITDAYRQAGIYAGRIIRGEKPADLPVIRSTKFEFVINLRTAKALGLEVPDKLPALADEVIE